MKTAPLTPFRRSRIRPALVFRLGCLLLAGHLLARAQARARPLQPPEPAQNAHASALAAARSGSGPAAENALRASIRAKPRSAEWHLEMAQRLLHVAIDLSATSGSAGVRTTIDLTLRQLELAEASAEQPRALAAVQAMRGFIYERFLGDRDASLAAYRAAAAHQPGNPALNGRVSQGEAAVAARRKALVEGGVR